MTAQIRPGYAKQPQMAADIERFLKDEPVLAGPPSAVYRFRKFAKRNRIPLAFVVTIFLRGILRRSDLAALGT